jgi:hypothetical protein
MRCLWSHEGITRAQRLALRESIIVRNRPEFADDPIPTKAIRLSAAFERVAEAVSKSPKIMEELEEQDIDCSAVAKVEDRWKALGEHEINCNPSVRRWKDQVAADILLRAYLTYGELLWGEKLRAYIRDPKTGEILELDSRGWEPAARSSKPFTINRSRYFETSAGISGDYVIDPYDEIFPGPEGTLLHGAYRPVFFWRDEFERWFKKTFGVIAPERKGRPRGSGSWEVADQPLLTAMHELIQRGAAKSALDAASRVVETAAGAGSRESKITRLAKRYNKQF